MVEDKLSTDVFLLRKVIIFVVFIIIIPGCQEELCEDITVNPLRIGFYVTEDGEHAPYRVDSLSVKGLGHDSLLYDNRFDVGRVEIPLNVSRDSCSFLFMFPDKADTLKVFYERNLTLVSIECGFVAFFEILDLEITNNFIRSYSIEEQNVTNVNEEHIHFIFYSDPG